MLSILLKKHSLQQTKIKEKQEENLKKMPALNGSGSKLFLLTSPVPAAKN
jgi:hypothetical protein